MDDFWQGKKVMVAGGLGFIGSHFIEELAQLGSQVVCLYRKEDAPLRSCLSIAPDSVKFDEVDLLEYKDLLQVSDGVDTIINCAALDGNTEYKIFHAAQMMDTNIRIASNILGLARERGVENVILMSSAEVYSPQAKNPIVEEDDYQKYNDYTVNGYVLSKRYTEILGDLYEHECRVKVYSPRPVNVYGPRDHFGNGSTRVIPSFVINAVSGKPVEIWGDGSQERQFLYVKDLVSSVLTMVRLNKFHKLNIAGDEVISILDLAKIIFSILGLREDIILRKDKPTGAKTRILETSKLKSLGGLTTRPLSEGLKETISWFKDSIKRL